MAGKYSVDQWGSHPDAGNDDCFTGEDFDTVEEALIAYNAPIHDSSVAYIEIDGLTEVELKSLGITRVRKNPDHKRDTHSQFNREWQREMANEAGMLGGCQAYNEAMGYD